MRAKRASACGELPGQRARSRPRLGGRSAVILPRPALAYEALEHFRRYGCIGAGDEAAVKRAVFNLSFGLAHARPAQNGSLLTEVLRNMTVKLMLWHYLSIEHEVEIPLVRDTRFKFSEYDEAYGLRGLLVGTNVWCTRSSAVMLHPAEASFATTSDVHRIRRLDIATIMCPRRVYQAKVLTAVFDKDAMRTHVDWRTCGSRQREKGHAPYSVGGYTTEPIALWSRSDPDRAARRRIVVRVREVRTQKRAPGYPGIAVIKAHGVVLRVAPGPALPPADLASSSSSSSGGGSSSGDGGAPTTFHTVYS